MTTPLEPRNDLWPDPKSTCEGNILVTRTLCEEDCWKKEKHLELQHVTGVVVNLDAQQVNIGRVGTTAAAILFVANDVGCHST